jgi:hypothetical protein
LEEIRPKHSHFFHPDLWADLALKHISVERSGLWGTQSSQLETRKEKAKHKGTTWIFPTVSIGFKPLVINKWV